MFRPFLGTGDGYRSNKALEAQRREEREAERRYEEAVGEVKTEEEAL
jgi:hypothetical protein